MKAPTTIVHRSRSSLPGERGFLLSFFLVAHVTFCLMLTETYAADGRLDFAFGVGGKVTTNISGVDHAFALAIQPDGKIVAAGYSDSAQHLALVRYNSNGDLDSTFGNAGKVIGDPMLAAAVAIQTNGKIVLGGTISVLNGTPGSGSSSDFALIRYNIDGTIDPSFGSSGKVTTGFGGDGSTDVLAAMVIQSDGRIVVAGTARQDFGLARYESDGTLDFTFGSAGKVTTDFFGLTDEAYALAIQSDGRIVVSGIAYRNNSGSTNFGLARYNSDGTLDSSFGSGGKVTTELTPYANFARAVTIQADGKIVAAGSALIVPGHTNDFDFALVRYNSDGTLDPGYGIGGKVITNWGTMDIAYASALDAQGRILLAGSANGDFAIARYNTDGSLDFTFGNNGKVTTDFAGGTDDLSAMVLQADRKIVLAGTDQNDFALARYRVTGPPTVPTPVGTDVTVEPGVAILTFSSVSAAGTTTLTTSSNGPPPPSADFKLGAPPTYYDLSTTAIYSGPINLCIDYSDIHFGNESNLKLYHFDKITNHWVTLPGTPDTPNKIICGSTDSLSSFAIFETLFRATVQPPVKADGSSIFNAKRGVVPLIFSLIFGGTNTCNLPPALLSLSRTSGDAPDVVNESEYLLSSDTGSNFRINNCQYMYNLATGSLGPGSYQVDIKIGSVVVGSATFALN
ncbi:MAG TPA: delta-60 repeat domain-containing protein [Acidobacteriota bacterium]|jgi:uncharacterized delta-60 repeat protein